ncbi:hypothetical protein [Streptomyces boninensis]|uniref:hypothetical protein n=1 Tax=Streptomyces boninensis TaxID=2039455 RepID=UPI003B226BD3
MSEARWARLAVFRRKPRSPQPSTDVTGPEDPNSCQVCDRAVPLLTATDIDEEPWPGGQGWLVNTGRVNHRFATRVCRDCWDKSLAIEAATRREAEEEVAAKTREAAAWLADAPVMEELSDDLRARKGWEVYGSDDAARHLGQFAVYGKGAMGYNAEGDDELPADYRDGVARPGYDNAQGCYLYFRGSVFRTTDGRIAVKWREHHREYLD